MSFSRPFPGAKFQKMWRAGWIWKSTRWRCL
nr:MAG TPA: hypothetical protein [Caudoviricetes sp.]